MAPDNDLMNIDTHEASNYSICYQTINYVENFRYFTCIGIIQLIFFLFFKILFYGFEYRPIFIYTRQKQTSKKLSYSTKNQRKSDVRNWRQCNVNPTYFACWVLFGEVSLSKTNQIIYFLNSLYMWI